MNKDILNQFTEKDLSVREIAMETAKSPTTIRYWLKKHNIKTNWQRNNGKYQTEQDRLIARRKQRVHAVSRRRKKLKQQAVKYLGGKCICCGYNKCIAALEFHHKSDK